jgi:hypothetical protein
VAVGRLSSELHRFLEHRRQHRQDCLTVRFNGVIQRLRIDDIEYIESSKRKLTCHVGGESIQFYGRMDDIEQLCTPWLTRIHQSYIANLRLARRLAEGELAMSGGAKLPVSKRYERAVRDAMSNAPAAGGGGGGRGGSGLAGKGAAGGRGSSGSGRGVGSGVGGGSGGSGSGVGSGVGGGRGGSGSGGSGTAGGRGARIGNGGLAAADADGKGSADEARKAAACC